MIFFAFCAAHNFARSFSLSLSLATARHIKPFASFAPARVDTDEMGFDNKKRKSNPSERRVQKRDFFEATPGTKSDREEAGPPHDRKKNGEGKYGATEYVRENEHFEKYYKAQKICASDESLSS